MTWKEILKSDNDWQYKNENFAIRPTDGAIRIHENGRNSYDHVMSKRSQQTVLEAYRKYSTLPNPTFETIAANDTERARFLDWRSNWASHTGTDMDWINENNKDSYIITQAHKNAGITR